MKVLVTGGLGFIGSHTVVELSKNKHEIVIVDNLINSKIEVLDHLEQITEKKIPFYQIDAQSERDMSKIFEKYKFDAVIHFAGLKAVGESVEKPIMYYMNNLESTMIVSKLVVKYNIPSLVFSSSATVYGNQLSPMYESMELKQTTNPYGETKAMGERILKDISKVNPELTIMILRYFNPVGAHESGLLGENPKGIPNNLMPFISKVAKGELPYLSIFGDDYKTHDGTGVRDYIHVIDLAKGHVSAVETKKPGVNIYNLGSGKGYSVMEMINTFEKVNHVNIAYKVVPRREGDIAVCFADVTKAKVELNWETKLSIEDMCRDMWKFEVSNS